MEPFAREFLSKCRAEAHLTQHDCNRIATQLNDRSPVSGSAIALRRNAMNP